MVQVGVISRYNDKIYLIHISIYLVKYLAK